MHGLAAAVAAVAAVMVAPAGQGAQHSAWSVALPSLPIASLSAREAVLTAPPGNRTFRIGDCDLVVAEAWGLVSGGVRGTGAVLHAFFTLFVLL